MKTKERKIGSREGPTMFMKGKRVSGSRPTISMKREAVSSKEATTRIMLVSSGLGRCAPGWAAYPARLGMRTISETGILENFHPFENEATEFIEKERKSIRKNEERTHGGEDFWQGDKELAGSWDPRNAIHQRGHLRPPEIDLCSFHGGLRFILPASTAHMRAVAGSAQQVALEIACQIENPSFVLKLGFGLRLAYSIGQDAIIARKVYIEHRLCPRQKLSICIDRRRSGRFSITRRGAAHGIFATFPALSCSGEFSISGRKGLRIQLGDGNGKQWLSSANAAAGTTWCTAFEARTGG